MTPHIAVIGAGVTGLAAIRELQKVGLRVTAFEASDRIGGLWNYQDSQSLPDARSHAAMMSAGAIYKNLRTNFPRALMTFHDYPAYPQECGQSARIYPAHETVCQYLHNYAQAFQLKTCIRFKVRVVDIQPAGDGHPDIRGPGWELLTEGVEDGRQNRELFDGLMVCNGHYTKHAMPDLPGLDHFHGLICHSHHYRRPENFQGQRVLVLGSGNSGDDICQDISREASRVLFCGSFDPARGVVARRERYGVKGNITQHGKLKKCLSTGVVTVDGERLDNIDIILLCTGYEYDLPFVGDRLKETIKMGDRYLYPLYQDLFCPYYPNLSFIGVPSLIAIFPLAVLQSRFAARVLRSEVRLPSEQAMLMSWHWSRQALLNSGLRERDLQRYRQRQYQYLNLLQRLSGDRPSFDPWMQYAEYAFQLRRTWPDDYRDRNFETVSPAFDG